VDNLAVGTQNLPVIPSSSIAGAVDTFKMELVDVVRVGEGERGGEEVLCT